MSRETYQLGPGERQWPYDHFWREREWVTWGEVTARTAVDKCWDVDAGLARVLLDASGYFNDTYDDARLLNFGAPDCQGGIFLSLGGNQLGGIYTGLLRNGELKAKHVPYTVESLDRHMRVIEASFSLSRQLDWHSLLRTDEERLVFLTQGYVSRAAVLKVCACAALVHQATYHLHMGELYVPSFYTPEGLGTGAGSFWEGRLKTTFPDFDASDIGSLLQATQSFISEYVTPEIDPDDVCGYLKELDLCQYLAVL